MCAPLVKIVMVAFEVLGDSKNGKREGGNRCSSMQVKFLPIKALLNYY